jgi:hypothetical protein
VLVTVAELGAAVVVTGGPLLLLFVMPGPELGAAVVVVGGPLLLLFVMPGPLLFVTAHAFQLSSLWYEHATLLPSRRYERGCCCGCAGKAQEHETMGQLMTWQGAHFWRTAKQPVCLPPAVGVLCMGPTPLLFVMVPAQCTIHM